MDIYEHVSDIIPAALRVISDVSVTRTVAHARSQLAAIASSDGLLQSISIAQAVAAILSAAFALLLIIAVTKKRRLSERPSDAPSVNAGETAVVETAMRPLGARWDVVRAHLESPHEAEWKEAVMEADKLVDDALSKAGYPGDTFGDRLTNIQPGTLISLDGIWWAHRVRNRLAHELDYFLRYTEARQAVGYYEQALSELKLL